MFEYLQFHYHKHIFLPEWTHLCYFINWNFEKTSTRNRGIFSHALGCSSKKHWVFSLRIQLVFSLVLYFFLCLYWTIFEHIYISAAFEQWKTLHIHLLDYLRCPTLILVKMNDHNRYTSTFKHKGITEILSLVSGDSSSCTKDAVIFPWTCYGIYDKDFIWRLSYGYTIILLARLTYWIPEVAHWLILLVLYIAEDFLFPYPILYPIQQNISSYLCLYISDSMHCLLNDVWPYRHIVSHLY